MIAEAAHELGLDGLTLRAVADHLDVSIAALYHHVSGKEDLMRLAAEYAAATVPIPQDTGQHWAVWLQEWATYNHDIFLAQPGSARPVPRRRDLRWSRSPPTSTASSACSSARGSASSRPTPPMSSSAPCALGSAVITTRERAAIESGASLRAGYEAVVAAHPEHDLPYLEALLEAIPQIGRRGLRERVTTALRGIAAERGIDWASVEAALAEAAQR